MADRIDYNEVVNPDVESGLKELIGLLEKVELQIREVKDATKDLTTSQKNNGEELKKITTKQRELEKGLRTLNATEKESQKLVQAQIRERAKQSKENVKAAAKVKELRDQTKRLVKEEVTQKGSINALIARTNKLVKQRANLNLQTKQGRSEFKALTGEIKSNTDKLKAYDSQIGRSQRKVGDYAGAVKGVALRFTAWLAGISGVIRVLKNMGQIVINFNAQMSEVKAITGATGDEFERLRQSAIDLGSSTKFTATEVGSLQVEFGKLGFSTQEILNATEATLNLAAATGESLAGAASVAGNTLRAFGLDASEMTRVTDVMARGFTQSALDLEAFRESMKFVAPIARAANIDLETTTALLGRLADNGLKGSIAGTSLKNLMSKLSNENSKLAKRLGFAVKGSDDLIKAFKELSKGNIDLTEATELTDERSKAAFLTFLSGVDSLEDLREGMFDTTITAEGMAEVMLDNLKGDTDLARSAWEGFVISLDEGTGIISNVSRNIVQGFTNIVNSLNILNSELPSSLNRWERVMIRAASGIQALTQTQLINVEEFTKGIKEMTEADEAAAQKRLESEQIKNELIAQGRLDLTKSAIDQAFIIEAEWIKRNRNRVEDEEETNKEITEEQRRAAEERKRISEEEQKKAAEDRKRRLQENNKEIEQLEKLSLEIILGQAQEHADLMAEIEEEETENDKDELEQRLANADKAFMQATLQRQLQLSRGEITEQEFRDEQLAAEEEFLKGKLELLKASGVALTAEQEKILNQLAENEIAQNENSTDREEEQRQQKIDKILQAAETINMITQDAATVALDIVQLQANKELEILQSKFDQGLISEDQFSAAKLAIQRDAIQKEFKIKVAAAIADAALAIVKGFAQLGPIGGAIAAVVTAAATAVQIKKIKDQRDAALGALSGSSGSSGSTGSSGTSTGTRTSSTGTGTSTGGGTSSGGGAISGGGRRFFAKGALIDGNPHSQGGTQFYSDTGMHFEAERGELLAIVNKKDTEMLNTLSGINSIHGNSFFKSNNKSFLQDGGVINPEEGTSENIVRIVEQVIQATKFVVVESDMTREQEQVKQIEVERQI
jgi:TP901 family phage tail tape measure protein